MKKLAVALLLGLTAITSVSHAYKDGDKMPCGKVYYSTPGLRSSEKGTLTAANAKSVIRQGDDGASFGPGVRRNN